VGFRRHVVVGDSLFEAGGDLRRRRGDDRGRRHRDALPVRETAPDTPGFESSIAVGTVELAEESWVLMRIEVPDEGAYDRLGIGVDVEVVATEYREDYDHGELSGSPTFAARPV
jgi:hypothetical protein